MIKLLTRTSTGTADITGIARSISWGGDVQSVARSLTFDIAVSNSDTSVPTIGTLCGTAVTLMLDNTVLFQGYIVDRSKSTSGPVTYKAYDRGMYLKRSQAVKQFSCTPEAAARQICSEFGIEPGDMATTGITIKRKFFAVTLYDVIMTMYTLAAQKSGKKYMLVFSGAKLCVVEKGKTADTLLVQGGVNLMDLTVSESSEKIINQAVIYNEDYSRGQVYRQDKSIQTYGMFQTVVRASEDAAERAKALIKNSEPEQKITANTLGDTRSITGGTVVIQEPYTGVCGLFYIDSDLHTWKNGQYYNKLSLNFENLMDEREAGQLPKPTKAKSVGSTKSGGGDSTNISWHYIIRPGMGVVK